MNKYYTPRIEDIFIGYKGYWNEKENERIEIIANIQYFGFVYE